MCFKGFCPSSSRLLMITSEIESMQSERQEKSPANVMTLLTPVSPRSAVFRRGYKVWHQCGALSIGLSEPIECGSVEDHKNTILLILFDDASYETRKWRRQV